MIEICNYENLELVTAGALGRLRLPRDRHNLPVRMVASGDEWGPGVRARVTYEASSPTKLVCGS
jgi:hypothetical protein